MLGSLSSSLSGSGVVAVDADCTSSLREPGGTATFYARRHTFTLDAAATVSVRADDAHPGWLWTYLVLTDSSGDVVGRAVGDSRHRISSLGRLLLPAGTYTVEVTSNSANETGGYNVWVNWVPAVGPLSVVLVDVATVELVYDVVLDAGSVPPVGAFGVVVDGSGRAVNAVAVAGQVVTLSLSSPVGGRGRRAKALS